MVPMYFTGANLLYTASATHADADKADSLLLHMDTAEETSKRENTQNDTIIVCVYCL